MITEAILCDWCQKRIPPESSVAHQRKLADQNEPTHSAYKVHFCNTDCQDKWQLAHHAGWEDFKE